MKYANQDITQISAGSHGLKCKHAVRFTGSQAVLRVWEREECVLHAIGEDVAGLLGPVCWQPNGRHIYAAQDVRGQQGVVLFERNGLSHGNFVTSSQEDEAGEMSSSLSSESLAGVKFKLRFWIYI